MKIAMRTVATRLGSVLLAVTGLAACDPSLEGLTAPPPGATAEVDTDSEVITLSRGAAIAVACTDGGDQCDRLRVQVADPSLADARVAYRNGVELTADGFQQPTAFVVFGKVAGRTEITASSRGGDVTYRLDIIP